MTQTKVDYAALEREFINSEDDISLREMAKREGVSNSTISDYARKHNWAEKRASRKELELREFIQITAEKNARRLARLSEVTVDVLEGTLIRFAEQLTQHLDEDGKPNGKDPIFISPKDAQDAIRLIRDFAGSRNHPEEGASGPTPVTINIGADLIAAVGELARGSLQPSRGAGARPIALPGGAAGDPERRPSSESA